jgi:hypothetical protein
MGGSPARFLAVNLKFEAIHGSFLSNPCVSPVFLFLEFWRIFGGGFSVLRVWLRFELNFLWVSCARTCWSISWSSLGKSTT